MKPDPAVFSLAERARLMTIRCLLARGACKYQEWVVKGDRGVYARVAFDPRYGAPTSAIERKAAGV